MPASHCIICDKVIKHPPSRSPRYCSNECRYADKRIRITKHCEVCDEPYERIPSKSPNSRFCSKKCRYSPTGRSIINQLISEIKGGKNTTTCATCGREFALRPYRERVNKNNYCSWECYRKAVGNRTIILTCDICGKTFKRNLSAMRPEQEHFLCSLDCVWEYQRSGEYRARFPKMNKQLALSRPTRLEIQGYQILDKLDVPYKQQWPVLDRYVVDAYIPSQHLVIEWHGDYWHGNPEKFPDFTEQQLRQIQQDRIKMKAIKQAGFAILCFWESEVKQNPNQVLQKVKASIRDVT